MQVSRASDQRTDPLRSAELVGGNRDQVDIRPADIEMNTPNHLDGIDVQQATGAMNNGSRRLDRLNDPGLVVGRHDGDEWRVKTLRLQFIEALLQGRYID